MGRDKTILVTGGAGCIGSHLCARLLGQDDTVICMDSLITGQKRNIQPLLLNNRFSFIQADVRSSDAYLRLPLAAIEEIYDLASPASVDYVSAHPIYTATTNSIGTYNLLELGKKHHAKVLFASSSETYGDPKEHPQHESYWGNVNPVGVRSGYDEGKRFGEALAAAYHREAGVDIRIARIFNTYGPNSSLTDGRVIPRFVTAALRGASIPVHGDGTQTRSFCYVDDLVDGLVKLMARRVTTPVNLGNPVELRIIDVARIILELTKSKSEIVFGERPPDDPARRMPDITLAQTTVSWQPKVSLEQGLPPTIEYFKTQLLKES